MKFIPLSVPNLAGNELKYLKECVDTNYVSSVGEFVTRFEDAFAKKINVKKAVAVVNGTAALHLSLLAFGVGREDEVIVPNLTFVAPVNAVKYVGANPILVDSNLSNFGMCVDSLEDFLLNSTESLDGKTVNKKTGRHIKAIIPMHTLGMPVDMDKLIELSEKYKIVVIEDASESLGSLYKGKHTGTIGDCGCFSFNGNKIITSGGGGMFVTNDENLAIKVKHLSTTAKTDGLNFIHDEVGYNYRMVNLLAAVGLAQLEQVDSFLETKRKNLLLYKKYLDGAQGFSLFIPEDYQNCNNWFYSIMLNESSLEKKDEFIQFLNSSGVGVRPIWALMEDLDMYRNSFKSGTEKSKKLFASIVNIPCSTDLTEKDIEEVSRIILSFKF